MSESKISRRTLAAGAAWAVPAVAVATAAPAFAASKPPQPGLNGWVTVNKDRCYTRTFDGTSNSVGPDGVPHGLFVWDDANDPETIEIENPTLVIYLRYSDYRFVQDGGSASWPAPQRCAGRDDTSTGVTMYAYCSTYTGGYEDPRTVAYNGIPHTMIPLTDKPKWKATRSGESCWYSTLWIRREVTINGVTTSCIRKQAGGTLVCDGGRSRRSAAPAAIQAETVNENSTKLAPM